jgi:membrane protein involved in colicin uptake
VVKAEDENDDADDLYGDASVGDASPKTPGGTNKSPFASATQPKRFNLKVTTLAAPECWILTKC